MRRTNKKHTNKAKPPKGGKGRGAPRPQRQTAPVSVGALVKGSTANISRLAGGSTRVRHKELISNIMGSVAFGLQAFDINPGLDDVFPWLAALAGRYESYVFHGLKFVYETIRATSVDGVVSMTADYDAADKSPTSRVEIMSHDGATRSAPWQSCAFASRVKNLRKRKTNYVRTGPVDVTEDIKTYDVGTFYVSTEGMPDTKQVGELYVEYDVELQTPIFEKVSEQGFKAARFWSPGPRIPTVAGGAFEVVSSFGSSGFLGQFSADGDPDLTLYQSDLSITSDTAEYVNNPNIDMLISNLTYGEEFFLRPGTWRMTVFTTLAGGGSTEPSFSWEAAALADGTVSALGSPFASVNASPGGGGLDIYLTAQSPFGHFRVNPLTYVALSCIGETASGPATPFLDEPLTTVTITPWSSEYVGYTSETALTTSRKYKPPARKRKILTAKVGQCLHADKSGIVVKKLEPRSEGGKSEKPTSTKSLRSGSEPTSARRMG